MPKKHTYVITSTAGLNLGGGAGLVGVGVQGVGVTIWNKASPKWSADYMMTGVSAGVGKARVDIAQIWSSSSEFESDLPSATMFYGAVHCEESSASAGVGYGYQRMVWVSGPARGDVVEGTGWSLKISLGVTIAQSSMLNLKYVGTSSPQSRNAVKYDYHRPPVQYRSDPRR